MVVRSTGVKRISLLIRREKDQEETQIGMQAVACRLGWESPSQGQTHAQTTDICPAGACEFLPICWTGNGRSMARGTLRTARSPTMAALRRRSSLTGFHAWSAPRSARISLPAGGRLVVHMEWNGDPAALTGGEKFFLHLLDESGNLVAQWDPEFRMDSTQVLQLASRFPYLRPFQPVPSA